MPRVGLRPLRADDEPFLRDLYASTREVELAALPEAMHRVFTDSQYDLQEHHYRAHFPGATWSVVEVDGAPVGRLIVDRTLDPWVLVDISVLPRARGRGVGTTLLRELQDGADRAARSIQLTVRVDNPRAQKLYSRLGFVRRANGDQLYITMVHHRGKGRME